MWLRNWFRIAFQFVALSALIASTPETLREAANASGVLIGTAVRRALLSQPAYASTLAREFNMVEPEDAMKWWTIRPTADNFDFDEADEIVRFAQVHEMKVRGHCLVWDHNNPKWLVDGHFTPAQLSRILHEHITKEMTHYAGQVFAWDVVNEAPDENGKPKDSIWYNEPGIGLSGQGIAYVEQAFRWPMTLIPRRCCSTTTMEAKASIANLTRSMRWSRISRNVEFPLMVSVYRCTSPASIMMPSRQRGTLNV